MCNPKVQIQRTQALLATLPVDEATRQLEELFASELGLFASLYGGSADERRARVQGQLDTPGLEDFHVEGWRQGKRDAWDFLCWIAARLRVPGASGQAAWEARVASMLRAAGEPMDDLVADVRTAPCGSI